jgi:hypothetical protein
MARQAGTDLDDVKTSRRSSKGRTDDKVEIHKFKPNVYETHRIFGPTYTYSQYWIKVKKKDGNWTKFPVDSPSWDPVKQEFDRSKYDPWYEYHLKEIEDDVKPEKRLIQVGVSYWTLSISRKKQKDEPARPPKPTKTELKTGFKEKDSDSYTAVVALRLPGTPVDKIRGFKSMNVVESKSSGSTKAYPVSHEKFGHDVRIKFDDGKDTAPANRYDVQYVEKRSPLTEEEQAYLKWDLSDLANEAVSDDELRRDFEGWAKRMGIKTSKKRKHDVEELDDELEDDDVESDEDDEDEDDAPRRGKKKPAAKKVAAKKSSKRKAVEDDEDEEDEDDEDLDDDEDDEDEDDTPRRGKSKKAPAKKVAKKTSKKSRDEDEDDEDEDDEDEEDEDDLDDDEDLDDDDSDDDEDEDEDDEDDEPPAKSKKKPAKKVAAKKAPAKKTSKKSRDEDEEDEDEDEDDDLDDDEDEDDEPVSKSKKKPAAKKVAAKKATKKKPARRSRDEDDEDEDEDEDEDD